jgi:hypothetical protein
MILREDSISHLTQPDPRHITPYNGLACSFAQSYPQSPVLLYGYGLLLDPVKNVGRFACDSRLQQHAESILNTGNHGIHSSFAQFSTYMLDIWSIPALDATPTLNTLLFLRATITNSVVTCEQSDCRTSRPDICARAPLLFFVS